MPQHRPTRLIWDGRMRRRSTGSILIGGLALAGLAFAASAQQPAQTTQRGGPSKQAQPTAPAQPAASDASSGLRTRVEQVEEQLVDMQQAVGTLESLVKSGGAGATRLPAAAPTSADATRLDALEAQLRTLTQQVDQLARDIRAQSTGAPRATIAAASQPPGPPAAIPPPTAPPPAARPPANDSFSTTVTPERDPIGAILGAGPAAAPVATGPADATAKALYETAYGFLLQQDYGAAEAGFEDFLRKHPSDPLAGNAQYWLGETHYVRGQYKQAANAFLKGYQAYARSAKAPDSLLKLGMALDRLGQKDASCQSFGELVTKFPNAPASVRSTADRERRRLGCA